MVNFEWTPDDSETAAIAAIVEFGVVQIMKEMYCTLKDFNKSLLQCAALLFGKEVQALKFQDFDVFKLGQRLNKVKQAAAKDILNNKVYGLPRYLKLFKVLFKAHFVTMDKDIDDTIEAILGHGLFDYLTKVEKREVIQEWPDSPLAQSYRHNNNVNNNNVNNNNVNNNQNDDQ